MAEQEIVPIERENLDRGNWIFYEKGKCYATGFNCGSEVSCDECNIYQSSMMEAWGTLARNFFPSLRSR